MKYFRVVNQADVTNEFYVSIGCDFVSEVSVKDFVPIADGYTFTECSKEEFETMTYDPNDYIDFEEEENNE